MCLPELFVLSNQSVTLNSTVVKGNSNLPQT